MGSHQPQEEEVFTSRTLYHGQGQGQGSELETLSIACCFGGMLLAQIKHSRKSKHSEYEYFVQTFQEQSSMSGVLYFTASALEMEKEECWFVFHHVGIEAFYPSRFLCGGS